jgi:catechol 2,3-dioxygenase-like lactoylglutathione lyase family enzyme
MRISHCFIHCRDQDEAKAFYTEVMGFELANDVRLDETNRWLTFRVPGQDDLELAAMPPGAGNEPELGRRVGEVLALGGLSGCILQTDDVHGDYERLKAAGVEFTEEPTQRFYGIDCGFRDPSGNAWRRTQPAQVPTA